MSNAVLILEDLPDTREWLADVVQQLSSKIQPVFAHCLEDARTLLETQPWQFMLIDLGLPDGSGISLLQEAHAKLPATPAIVTTIYDDDDNLFQSMAAGAAGYLLKSQPTDTLLHQLSLLQQGFPPMSASIARRLAAYFQDKASPHEHGDKTTLNAREQDILSLIGQGLRTREVAQHLGLTEYTVTTYIRNLYEKLNISTRAEATIKAAQRGLISI